MEKMYLNYIQPKDVALRLFYSKRHWFHGNPKVELLGKEGHFGTLRFDFIDQVVEYRVYIKDREAITAAAKMAVLNFSSLSQEIILERSD